MSTTVDEQRFERTKELKAKKICRFCLSQNQDKLTNIYARRVQKVQLEEESPLTVQVMACASIEPFPHDGMPSWICHDCRLLFNHSYRFKNMCKSAEMLLRQFPLTGEWPNELAKPKIPLDLLPASAQATLKKAAQQAKQQQHDQLVRQQQQQAKQQQQDQQLRQQQQELQQQQQHQLEQEQLQQQELEQQQQQQLELQQQELQQQQLQQQQQQEQSQKLKHTAMTKTRVAVPTPQLRQIPLKQQNAAGGDGRCAPKKLLNSNPVSSPEPPAPMRLKKEKLDEESTIFLNKVENNEELSLDDVQRLIAAADNETEFIDVDDVQVVQAVAAAAAITTTNSATSSPSARKPKLLNKSSIRILNKEAQLDVEPRLSLPKVKRDVDGNVAIVTEILDPGVPYEMEPDPIKTAAPVETNVFPCPHCERSFPLRQLRDIHMVNHNRERGFQCPDCDKSFFSKYDLQKHNLIHTGDRPFKCTVCSKTFTRGTLLHRHEKTHTDIPKLICIYCEKPFISKDAMEKHMERHRKNRPYQCKVCKKAFAFKQGLERHELVHSRDQPYPCQYCDLSFSTPSKLARHLTAHAGRRPYPCKFCSKQYLLSHHLTRHLRSHKQGADNYSCNDCEKCYKTRDELIYHSAVHATVTLVCPLCKEQFADIKAVTAHIKDHAEGDSYACEFCDLIFMTSDRLLQHTEEEHVDDMAAYLEDDIAQEEKTNQSVYDEEPEERSDLETLEEFLSDELPAGVQILEHEVIQNSGIKLEKSPKSISKHAPQVISQIIYRTQDIDVGNVDNSMILPDDNILVSNEAEQHSVEELETQITEEAETEPEQVEALEEDDYETEEVTIARSPPAKIRRVAATKPAQRSLVRVAAEKPKEQQHQLRRKVAVPPPAAKTGGAQQSSPPVKIGDVSKTKSSVNINSVLNALPKGLSVRRKLSAPAVTSPATSPEAAKQTLPQKQRLVSSRRSNNSVDSERSQSKPQSKPEKLQILEKRSPVTYKQANALTTGAANKSQNQTAAAKVGPNSEKKMKLQKIVMTKAKAAEMAKQGRILIKDGNMILKPNTTKTTRK